MKLFTLYSDILEPGERPLRRQSEIHLMPIHLSPLAAHAMNPIQPKLLRCFKVRDVAEHGMHGSDAELGRVRRCGKKVAIVVLW